MGVTVSVCSASRNLHISCVKELLESAFRDRIITASPAAHLRTTKREKPIPLTPMFEQFKAIFADVRSQAFNPDAHDSADFLEFLGLAGLGQAETGSLTSADVDFTAGQIFTYRHKTSTGFSTRSAITSQNCIRVEVCHELELQRCSGHSTGARTQPNSATRSQ